MRALFLLLTNIFWLMRETLQKHKYFVSMRMKSSAQPIPIAITTQEGIGLRFHFMRQIFDLI